RGQCAKDVRRAHYRHRGRTAVCRGRSGARASTFLVDTRGGVRDLGGWDLNRLTGQRIVTTQVARWSKNVRPYSMLRVGHGLSFLQTFHHALPIRGNGRFRNGNVGGLCLLCEGGRGNREQDKTYGRQ